MHGLTGPKIYAFRILQHRIKLDISIPLTHQAKYEMNPNYDVVIKHDIDKLWVTKII